MVLDSEAHGRIPFPTILDWNLLLQIFPSLDVAAAAAAAAPAFVADLTAIFSDFVKFPYKIHEVGE